MAAEENLEKFEILFEEPRAVFYAGQKVTGRVFVRNNLTKKFKGIKVTFEGVAHAEWSGSRALQEGEQVGPSLKEQRPQLAQAARQQRLGLDKNHRQPAEETWQGPDTVRVAISNDERYFQTEFYLVGSKAEDGAEKICVDAGELSYPFEFSLPKRIPSSFEGSFGHVRYTVRAVMERPWASDLHTQAPFTVVCPLDLNANPSLAEPVQVAKVKKFCSIWCASGPVNVTFTLASGGAVPGEFLLPSLDVENNSKLHLHLIKLKFSQIVTYKDRTGSETLRHETILAEQNVGKVDSGDSRLFDRLHFYVPPLPPSNTTHCTFIDVQYYLKANFYPSACYPAFSAKLAVVLGTIPLHKNFGRCHPCEETPPVGWNLNALDQNSSLYAHLPPPSYEQVEKDEDVFTPKYPVHKQTLRFEEPKA
ncbi:arrestin domain-containing protein 17-like [Neocloeon triangulifer]|uniref:arrestin domain-containing protein 17-like n=1 Tax=Neocloeon triangulifer TaxID=2078957 RepID=UPI00286F638C|nr:arrestin domain-containing protein 17-like [Neocloeon triangulifer]